MWYEKKPQSKLQSTSYTATAASEATAEIKHLLELPKDVYNEIERLIGSIVVPYVDPSNPALHFDELIAECKAKLAKLIHDGKLTQCPTRAKFFAFLKTAFKNHVRSLIQKHVFTASSAAESSRRKKVRCLMQTVRIG